ncbi:hypothetical protein BH09BAC3_BH09BAC3_15650 [soil metagenome]
MHTENKNITVIRRKSPARAVAFLCNIPSVVKKNLLLIFFLITISTAYTQPYNSEGNTQLGTPYFQLDQIKGCAPLTIAFTNLIAGNCTGANPCTMRYETGFQQNNAFTHTFVNPGTYRVEVIYQGIGSDFINITVVPNVQPNFEIYACSGNSARIKVVDNTFQQYVIDFNNDGTPENILPFSNNILTPPHAYVPPGVYVASVRGRNTGSADNCTAKTQPFTSLAVLPTPTMNTLTSIDATSIKLDFSIATNVQYRVEIGVNTSSVFSLYQLVYGINTLTVPNLKLDDNFYCFRIGAFDPCTGATTYSNTVCSDKFIAKAASDVNQLAWITSSSGVTNYSIVRNGAAYFTTGAQTFNDTSPNIVCKTNYCYRVTTNYAGGPPGGAKSISLEKCVTSFSNKIPTIITNTSAVVSNGVELTWLQDPAFIPASYTVSRSANGGAYNSLANVATPKIVDDVYTTADKYCYKVNYIDKCDNISPLSTPICPIRLLGTLDVSNVISLNWSSYKGWKNGVKNYILEKYNLAGSLIASVSLTDTVFVDNLLDLTNQFVRYRVTATSNDPGLTISVSNDLDFIKNANLFYPTAFTPNGDNLNDQFRVAGQYIKKINLKVFDRWGALIFATEKDEPWSGLKEGKAMPPSAYIWKVEITDLAGRTFSKEGTVVLMLN